jgi:hypothetical protein
MCDIIEYLYAIGYSIALTEETNGPVLLFLGGGYGLKQLMLQVVVAFYVALWTLVVMLRKQYSKTRFWLIVVLCVLSYVFPIGRCGKITPLQIELVYIGRFWVKQVFFMSELKKVIP